LMLGGHGYDVVLAPDGESAVAEVARRNPDVMLLDLMLPRIDGLEVCRRVRARSAVPIIVLSARGEESVKVEALDLGADDYLTKPFSGAELLARVRAALRRSTGSRTEPAFEAGDLRIDFVHRRVTRGGREIALTPKEYDVLKYLVTNVDRVIT